MEKPLRVLFIYGILKRRYPNAQQAKVRNFRLIDLGQFPAAIPEDGSVIIGELIAVDDETVEEFDMIEGHPNFYIRTDIEVEIDDGSLVEIQQAQMYVIHKSYHDFISYQTRFLAIKEEGDEILYEYFG